MNNDNHYTFYKFTLIFSTQLHCPPFPTTTVIQNEFKKKIHTSFFADKSIQQLIKDLEVQNLETQTFHWEGKKKKKKEEANLRPASIICLLQKQNKCVLAEVCLLQPTHM